MPQHLEWIAALPPGLQFAVMIGVGIALGLIARSGYLAGKKEPPVTAKDMVITAAGITDMAPVRDLVIEVKGLREAQGRSADELGTIRQILAEDAENRQDDRNYRRGLEAGRREPPTRRR